MEYKGISYRITEAGCVIVMNGQSFEFESEKELTDYIDENTTC